MKSLLVAARAVLFASGFFYLWAWVALAVEDLDGQARLQQALGALEGALQQPLDSMGETSSTASSIHTSQSCLERSTKPATAGQAMRLK